MTEKEFIEELEKIGINPTEKQLNNLKKYYELLIEWNKKINLTRITDEKDVYLKHFYDSLTIVKVVDLTKEKKLLDFGTGAGFPGMVIKIFFEDLDVTLVDSLNKRVIFLNEVIKELNLKNIKAIHERVENLKNENYDVITTRAVANLSKLIEYTDKLINNSNKLIPMKAHVEEEIKEAEKLLNKKRLIISKKEQFNLPYENSLRNILVIEKN